MNEENEQFEQRLKRQPLRPAPADWRAEILSAAAKAQPVQRSQPIASTSFLTILRQRLASFFWPHPVAWAGLAAVWLLIFGVHFSIRDRVPVMAEKVLPSTPEVAAELKQQNQMLAELMGSGDVRDADRPKMYVPKPRSERVNFMTV